MPTVSVDELRDLLTANHQVPPPPDTPGHPMLDRLCLIRTYAAGVHAGTVVWVNPDSSTEIMLHDAVRIWKWTGGGLSLSAIGRDGMKGGRVDRTGTICLTGVIEMIPITSSTFDTFLNFLER